MRKPVTPADTVAQVMKIWEAASDAQKGEILEFLSAEQSPWMGHRLSSQNAEEGRAPEHLKDGRRGAKSASLSYDEFSRLCDRALEKYAAATPPSPRKRRTKVPRLKDAKAAETAIVSDRAKSSLHPLHEPASALSLRTQPNSQGRLGRRVGVQEPGKGEASGKPTLRPRRPQAERLRVADVVRLLCECVRPSDRENLRRANAAAVAELPFPDAQATGEGCRAGSDLARSSDPQLTAGGASGPSLSDHDIPNVPLPNCGANATGSRHHD